MCTKVNSSVLNAQQYIAKIVSEQVEYIIDLHFLCIAVPGFISASFGQQTYKRY